MEYSFVKDNELREKLEKVRESKRKSFQQERKVTKDKNNQEETSVNEVNGLKNKSTNKVKGQEKTKNKQFEALKAKKSGSQKKRKLKKPPTKTLAVTTKQLASMVRTGLPLLEALNILSDSTEDKTLKAVFREASIGISRGSTFVEILEKHPEVFDDMYTALVAAGEAAGLLDDVLEREAALLESLAKIKGQITSAMTYPIAIFVLTIIVVFIMLIFVIPVFVDIYSSSGAELPALTQFLVDASKAIKDPQFLIKVIPTIAIIFVVAKKQMSKEYFLNWKDAFLLKLPITKDLITKSCLANFSRTLSALNTAGVPILDSLAISKRTVGNRVFKRIVDRMNTDIQAGQPIYRVLAVERKVIPVMFTSMFRIGEETGELSQMVNKLADFYEDEVATAVKSLTSILEPLMIVFVAVIVAFILVAMYLPMFNMMSTAG